MWRSDLYRPSLASTLIDSIYSSTYDSFSSEDFRDWAQYCMLLPNGRSTHDDSLIAFVLLE